MLKREDIVPLSRVPLLCVFALPPSPLKKGAPEEKKRREKCFPSCCCRGTKRRGQRMAFYAASAEKYGFGEVLIFAVI